MITVVWLALLAFGAALEVLGRVAPTHVASASSIVAALWRRPVWRAAIVVAWAFIGWHVFTRYTIAP